MHTRDNSALSNIWTILIASSLEEVEMKEDVQLHPIHEKFMRAMNDKPSW